MKDILAVFAFVLCISSQVIAQQHFKPVHGGLEDVDTGKSYRLVEMKGKDSLQIYNALLAMVKETFDGSEDKILEKKEGNYIKAYGYSRRGLVEFYDIKLEVEFKIKNDRYIYSFPKFNIESDKSITGKNKRVLIKQGSNFSPPDEDTSYLLNKKGKATLKHKSTYKDLIKFLDYVGNKFDISDEFEKYEKQKIDEEDGW